MREKEKCILAPLYRKIFYNLSFIDDCNLYELPFLVFYAMKPYALLMFGFIYDCPLVISPYY